MEIVVWRKLKFEDDDLVFEKGFTEVASVVNETKKVYTFQLFDVRAVARSIKL